jgi:hypothetical protein
MSTREWYNVTPRAPALIVYWPDADGGLWDPQASRLVDGLTDITDAFVTCVGSGRGAMSLEDAVAAARFMGCSSAVIVMPQGTGLCDEVQAPPGSRMRVSAIESDRGWDVAGVYTSYRDACRDLERAA